LGFLSRLRGWLLDGVAFLFTGTVITAFVGLSIAVLLFVIGLDVINSQYDDESKNWVEESQEQMKSVRASVNEIGMTCYEDAKDLPEWAGDVLRNEVMELPEPLSWGYEVSDEVCFSDEEMERVVFMKMTLNIKRAEFMKYVDDPACHPNCQWGFHGFPRNPKPQDNIYHYFDEDEATRDWFRGLSVMPDEETLQFRLMLIKEKELTPEQQEELRRRPRVIE